MHIIYDDKKANRSGDSYRLILLNSGWHVVANGYLCKVVDEKEGRRVLADFHITSLRNQPSIDKA